MSSHIINKNVLPRFVPKTIAELYMSIKLFFNYKKWIYTELYNDGFILKENNVCVVPPIRYIPSELKDQTFYYFLWHYKPKNGDVIFDIGAGMGTELPTYCELIGQTGLVYSFEPHFKSASICKNMIRVNRLNNVQLLEFATSDVNGLLHISDDPNSLGINSVVNKELLSGPVANATSITLDSFIENNNIKKIDFLKMNIEGGEVNALKGFERHINRVQNLAISCHDFIADYEGGGDEMRTKECVLKILSESGFKIIERKSENDHVLRDMIYATR